MARLPRRHKEPSEQSAASPRVRRVSPFAMIEALEGRQLLSVAPVDGIVFADAQSSVVVHAANNARAKAHSSSTAAAVVTLTSSLSNVSSGSILAGKSGAAFLNVVNKGNAKAAGTLAVTLSLSQNGYVASSGTAPLATASVTVQVGAHGSKRVKLPFEVPTSVPAGTYFAIATATFTSTTAATVTTPTVTAASRKTFTVRQPPQSVTTPSLIGKYKGTVKPDNGGLFGGIVNSVIGKQSIELDITGQAIDSLTGKITVDGHSASGTLEGKLLSNGNFHYELSGDGYDLKISGHVKPDGSAMSGEIGGSINGSSSLSLQGKFNATFQATSS